MQCQDGRVFLARNHGRDLLLSFFLSWLAFASALAGQVLFRLAQRSNQNLLSSTNFTQPHCPLSSLHKSSLCISGPRSWWALIEVADWWDSSCALYYLSHRTWGVHLDSSCTGGEPGGGEGPATGSAATLARDDPQTRSSSCTSVSSQKSASFIVSFTTLVEPPSSREG